MCGRQYVVVFMGVGVRPALQYVLSVTVIPFITGDAGKERIYGSDNLFIC